MALVATNSIVQGEQVAMLFPHLFKMNLTIDFAYPSFAWKNNAKDPATHRTCGRGRIDRQ